MALDGLTCSLLAFELNSTFSNSRIDRIYMPDKFTLIFHIRANSINHKLLISFNPSSPRIHITKTSRENPQMPPSFCMLLRKYCQGAKISAITCPDYERIIEISFETIDELHDTKQMKLVIELMGKYSNCILLNSQGRIIDSAIHVDYSISRIREVMPARIYDYPPSQNKYNVEESIGMLNRQELPIREEESSRSLAKALLNSIKGTSPLIINQLCQLANIDSATPFKSLSEEDIIALRTVLLSFLAKITQHNISPNIILTEDGQAQDFYFINLPSYSRIKSRQTISDMIDDFYIMKESNIDFELRRNNLLELIKSALIHATKKYDIHNNEFEEGKNSDKYKQFGDILLCNAYRIEGKETSIVCTNIYDELQRDVEIKLDPSLSASDNAQEYYKRFRKAKRKFELASQYLEEDRNAIDYLRTLMTATISAITEDDLNAINEEINEEQAFKKKERASKHINNPIDPNKSVGQSKSGKASSRALRYAAQKARNKNTKSSSRTPSSKHRHYLSSDGHDILCGRNNIQNEKLTFKIANKEDWWFHIKGLPGTHVILVKKPNESMPSDSSIEEAAMIAAFYSKNAIVNEHQISNLSTVGNIKAEVDYCPVSHVKKIPKSKPGMVIYEGYYSINAIAKDPRLQMIE